MTWKNDILFPVIGPLLKSAARLVSRTRLPQASGRLQLKQTGAPVEILRDRWGIPHIYARSAEDALFAQGFVHAQERLFQMDFTRRVVAGRLAEVIGEGVLPVDRAMRTLGFRQVTEQETRQVSDSLQPLLASFCAGVNAWIETAIARRKLPLEFTLLGYSPEPWTLADSLGWAKLMSWTLAGNWESEFLRGQIVQRLGPEKAAQLELNADRTWAVILDAGRAMAEGTTLQAARDITGSSAGDGVGSNNWVVHGTRTASGLPLLANDMHLGLTLPAIWYENHLSGGELEVTGISLPGVPLVIVGHNRHVAWGFTDGLPDVQDLYEEHLRQSPDGSWEVEFMGEWRPVTIRREEIRIKGGKSVVEEVLVTGHGPVINIFFKEAFPDTPPLALRWTALEPETTFEAIYGMNFAHDCKEFRQALSRFSGPSQNIVYADTQGNIAYQLPGTIPIRARGDGSVPSPGWSGDYEWQGYIPFEELPHLENPGQGFIATANNPVSRPDFPHFIGRDYCTSDRAARIIELLQAYDKVDIPYIKTMHMDQVSLSARALAHCLGQLEVEDPELKGIAGEMWAWDGKLDASSPLAAIYQVTFRQAVRLLLDHHLGPLGVRAHGKGPARGLWDQHTWEWFIDLLYSPDSPWFDLGNGEQRDDVLRIALQRAVDFLKQELGPDRQTWAWGKLHQLTFGHVMGSRKPLDAVFNLGSFPIGGDSSTIWATATNQHDLGHAVVVGPPFRFIADLSDLDHCWGVLAPGQSAHLASPHLADGVKPWFEGGYHPMLFKRAEVEQNLEARLIIE